MLYERWQEVARQRRRELALCELESGRRWTFGQLSREAEMATSRPGAVVCPQGHSGEFVLAVLRGWRSGGVICPLEPHQTLPKLPAPPRHCRHLKTTSASTGLARMIAFTEAQLAADADAIVATMGLRPDWPNLGVISLAHSYGFSNLVLPLLLHGIPLFLCPAPLPGIVTSSARGFGHLTLAGVPALWRAWHEADALPAGLRLAISAGAPLPVALEQAVFAARGLKIHNFYGSSECGGIAYDSSARPRSEDACVGKPMKGVKLSVGRSGTLVVRGPAVGQTYWPEAAGHLGRRRFQTGDLAELAGGWVYLRGRAGDQINIAGRKVSPLAIEAVLRSHESVEECLVFSVPSRDTTRVELIVACVASKQASNPEELKQFLLSRIPSWQVPRAWWFVKSLEPNRRGKLSRNEWRGRFLSTGSHQHVKAE